MTGASWLTFALVAGFVWGGFLVLGIVAMRKERSKRTGADAGRVP